MAQTLALAMLVFVIAAGAGLLGAMGRLDRPTSSAPSAVPVIDEDDAVGLLRVQCIERGAGIEVPAVNAKADGVHVAIDGTAGQKVFFQSDAGLVYPMQLREDGGTFELPLPPGLVARHVCSRGIDDTVRERRRRVRRDRPGIALRVVSTRVPARRDRPAAQRGPAQQLRAGSGGGHP